MRVYWKCQTGPVCPMTSPSKRIALPDSPTILVYLPISRFAVARSSSVTSFGRGNSAISLISVRDDTFRLAQATAAVEELTRNGVCDHRAVREREGRKLCRCVSSRMYLYDRRGHTVFHTTGYV